MAKYNRPISAATTRAHAKRFNQWKPCINYDDCRAPGRNQGSETPPSPRSRSQRSTQGHRASCNNYQSSILAMALIQTTLIWVVYAVVVALLVAVASIFVYLYQAPRERSVTVSIVCIFTLSALLATVLLLPVDVALVSSTTSSKLGRRKDWATDARVANIVYTLKVVYYALYSLDAVLCLLVVPFTYFWYEEYDEVAAEEGNQTIGSRFMGALKYTLAFVILVIVLFLVGFFVPVARDKQGAHYGLEYFKRILEENRQSSTHLCTRGLLTYSLPRWRTCPDLCNWTPYHTRNAHLYSVHGSRICALTRCVH